MGGGLPFNFIDGLVFARPFILECLSFFAPLLFD